MEPLPRQAASPSPAVPAPLTLDAPPPGAIRCRLTDERVCILTFDRPDSSANILDRSTLEELERHLRWIEAQPDLQGLVLVSAKPAIFIAGADIKSLSQRASPEEISSLVQLGQTAFNRIAALPFPTLAAIHGACLGGGYEICLACDYRIASSDRATRVGLPETQLGILPAWGGTTRLPRLIGLPAALDIILAGKTLAAQPALKRGMIDSLAPKETLLPTALALISAKPDLKHRRKSWRHLLFNNPITAWAIRKRMTSVLLQRTRGHYPAVLKALEVATRGLHRSIPCSLRLESNAIAELCQTDACRNLLRLFLLQERAKKLGATDRANHRPVERLAVIGSGVMGAGIAQWTSARSIAVTLCDVGYEQVAKGMAQVAKLYRQAVQRHALSRVEARAGMDRILPTAQHVPLHRMDLIIEAAVEKLPLKQEIFRKLDAAAGDRTILATNTSALSVSEIAQATTRPERVIGIHFFNPVHRMQLVEVVVGNQTSPETIQRSLQFVQQLGKLPVVVRDRPGFLVNRILVPYLIEAGRLFECGARVEDVDEAMLEFGMPMGPLRLIDEVGVDVASHVANTLVNHFPDRLQLPQILGRLAEAGHLGRKAGIGFYTHHHERKEPRVNAHVDRWRVETTAAALSREELRSRMVLLMVNEAARCLEEGVVQTPEDVDFGMVMGTGFAPFRGGPLRWAETCGLQNIVAQMETLAASAQPVFAPCETLRALARQNSTFRPTH